MAITVKTVNIDVEMDVLSLGEMLYVIMKMADV